MAAISSNFFGAKITAINLESVQKKIEQQGDEGMAVAVQAINDTAEYAFDLGRESILDQIAFPAGYLDLPGRYLISRKAVLRDPQASIVARDRPTALSRFVTSAPAPLKKGPVRVRVSRKGSGGTLRGAFITPLKGGNKGVAIRVKRGEGIRGRDRDIAGLQAFREDEHGTTYLLYGPSVNQVFFDVVEDIEPNVSRFLVDRFSELYKKRFG